MGPARTFGNLPLGGIRLAFLVLTSGLLLMAASGCGSAAGITGGTFGNQRTVLRIVRTDGSAKEASLKDLESLGQGKIFVNGKWEEGPTLPEVLRFAGVVEFQHVTIIGSGAPPLTLPKEEVNSEVILDFTNHGTVEFCSPLVPESSWVHEITTIKAE